MKYVIGIDGGGTKSIVRAVSLQAKLLGETRGGPTNINSLPPEQVKQNIKIALDHLTEQFDLRLEDCAGLCLGTAGVDVEEYKLQIAKLITDIGVTGDIYVTNDTITALVAGCGKMEGVIVIAGTGSVALGVDSQQNIYQSGGWGHVIGDEGSGYWIGRQGIIEAVKSSDGRGPDTGLLQMLMQELGLHEPKDFIRFVFDKKIGKQEIASLAVVVDRAYQAGDDVAKAILQQAARDNFLAVKAVINNLDFKENKFNIVVHGSVLTKNGLIFSEFSKFIKQEYPRTSIIVPQLDAAWGAVYIALSRIKLNRQNPIS